MNDQSAATSVVELNVGGVFYSTTWDTLRREPEGLLSHVFSEENAGKALKDSKGKFFIDRDGVLFRYILDYLRNLNLVLPENFHEKDRLRQEAEYFRLPNLVKVINAHVAATSVPQAVVLSTVTAKDPKAVGRYLTTGLSTGATVNNTSDANNGSNIYSRSCSPGGDGKSVGFITVGYRGTFAFGRDGLADVKFRKIGRIIVSGKVSLCREVFKDTLNENRDPDRGDSDRYTSRFFLKHSFLEQAFDMLLEEGFFMASSCASGTNSAGEIKPGMDTEEAKWQHYNEFSFERR